MNIWHQRLLKFSMKILLAIISIVIVCLFLYYHFYFKKDNLIKYVPENALVYATFRIDGNLTQNSIISKLLSQIQADYILPELDLNQFNNFISHNAAFAVMPMADNSGSQYNYLLILSLKPQEDSFENISRFIEPTGLKYELLRTEGRANNLFVASDSQDILEKVKKINAYESDSLVSNVNVVVNLKRLKAEGKIYINVAGIINRLDKLDNILYKLALAELRNSGLLNLFLGLKINGNQLILETSSPIADSSAIDTFIASLPLDFKYSLGFSNADRQIRRLESNLKEIAPELAQKIGQNKEYWQELYDFDWALDIKPLLSNKGQLIINEADDWILSLDLANISDREVKIDKLESIIKEYAAYSNPIEKQKKLPDYTYITQIVKNSDVIFYNEKITDISIKKLEINDFTIAYYIYEDNIVLANSSENLINLISSKHINQGESALNDFLSKFSDKNQILVANGDYFALFNPYFQFINQLIIVDNLKEQQVLLILK